MNPQDWKCWQWKCWNWWPFALFVLAVLIIIVVLKAPITPLEKRFTPKELDAFKFYADYLKYLSALAAAGIALAGAVAKDSMDRKKMEAGYAIVAFLIALCFITMGFATRNMFLVEGKSLPLMWIIDPVFGAVTAVSFITGVIFLFRLFLIRDPI